MKKKVLIAMSGGIDSSVAALLLLEQGYELIGVTFRNYDAISTACFEKEKGCCNIDSLLEAKKLAERLGFEHHIIDIREEFDTLIIQHFIEEYLQGRTPNPCVRCNKLIKWGLLFDLATQYGCSHIATGHYAQIAFENHRFFLKKGKDITKDQSYFLWTLTQEHLASTLFPLGAYHKEEVRKIAAENGFEKLSQKKESQEICFIDTHDYRHFLQHNVPHFHERYPEGDFVNKNGEFLGKHCGFPNYTIGQRKGLGIALGYPAYVLAIHPEKNQVVLGKKEDLYGDACYIDDINLMKYDTLPSHKRVNVKVRYRSSGAEALLQHTEEGVLCRFASPIDAITPGQSAVFYEENDVVGGGVIRSIVDINSLS